jgi:3',5'-cyclic AMP phosphodiesterase CpdA
MLIAQISDLHIKEGGKLAYGIVDTAGMLSECVASIMRQNPLPDFILITGDMGDYGRKSEYDLLKELLKPLTMPMYVVVGNHDERQGMRESFRGGGFEYLEQCDEFVQYAVDLGGLRLITLDTAIPMEGRGKLCAKRLAWLDERLGEDHTPTPVAMHHPPFLTGISHMDAIGLEGSIELEEIISRHSHVERLLCGHLHRSIQCRFGNTLASTCPSPAHQVAFDLRVDGPDCFVMEPPGYQMHLWRNGRLLSHTCAIGNYAGPYRFREGGVLID